jgi:hypothetical protein
MSIIERLIEGKKNKPIGEINERRLPKKNEPVDWFVLIFGQFFFWILIYFIVRYCLKQEIPSVYFISIVPLFFSYCLLGFFIDIKPRYDNMGFGGFVDNPFRHSDDVNRTLFFFKVILSPALLMSLSFVQLIILFKICMSKFFK